MKSIISALAGPLAGDTWKRRVLAPEIANSASIARALRVIRGRWPNADQDSADEEAPIFLLSAGWGSGSTLVQRLIMSDQQSMLWGEPFDHALPIGRLAQTIAPVHDRWPRDKYFVPPDEDKPLELQWIANLTPPFDDLRLAHRAFLKTWLREPTRTLGRTRWGFKEVRLTADHGRYLQWLFPRARFVFIYRDVLAAWRSCQNVRWLSVWPEHKVARVSAFAHHWVHLLSGFLDAKDELDAFLVRYEDLVAGNVDLGRLAEHLNTTTLDAGVLDVRVGERGKKARRISILDEAIIRRITGSLRSRLNYDA